MKHKYCGIICEKANNMDLVIFAKKKNDGKIWRECSQDTIPSDSGYCEYFACLPKHKKAVLHSLNGGESVSDDGNGDWCLSSTELWYKDWWYMLKSYESKIKPKKEKRWVGYCASRNQTFPHLQGSKELAWDYAARNYSYHTSEWQVIEIEVEV